MQNNVLTRSREDLGNGLAAVGNKDLETQNSQSQSVAPKKTHELLEMSVWAHLTAGVHL